MTDFGDVGRDETLNFATLGAAATPPAVSLFVQLHTGAPGIDGLSNIATENTRKAMSFGAAALGIAATDTEIEWTALPATETFSHVSIHDLVTGGDCWYQGALNASVPVTAGGTFKFLVGDAKIQHV